MAAGLDILEHNIPAFQTVFEEVVHEMVCEDDLSQTFITDGDLRTYDITLEQAQNLARHIWGQGFAPPSLIDGFHVARQQPLGAEDEHKRVRLQKDGYKFEAMFWRYSEDILEYIRTVYRPVTNKWRNQMELQLYIGYWEAA